MPFVFGVNRTQFLNSAKNSWFRGADFSFLLVIIDMHN